MTFLFLSRSVRRSLYRWGSSGDQFFAPAIFITLVPLPLISERASTLLPSIVSAKHVIPFERPCKDAVTSTCPARGHVSIFNERIDVFGTGSSQTVCQMPLVEV